MVDNKKRLNSSELSPYSVWYSRSKLGYFGSRANPPTGADESLRVYSEEFLSGLPDNVKERLAEIAAVAIMARSTRDIVKRFIND
jgi:hypothetical protein